MMPHEWCQQRDRCWLKSFSETQATEPPRFLIGQVVVIAWYDTETETTRFDRGRVLGVTLPLPNFRLPGWWYFIQITHMDGKTFDRYYCVDEVHESEVREAS